MNVGYATVSTDDQKLELQHDALSAHGCERIFEEKISGAGTDLPVRKQLLAYARRGDCIVVWKLERLGRSLSDLVEIVKRLSEREIGLCSLCESIDTMTPAGRLTLHLFAVLAEFEAGLVRERTRAGLDAARRRGARLGRPSSLSPEQIEMARSPMKNPRLSARQIAAQFGVAPRHPISESAAAALCRIVAAPSPRPLDHPRVACTCLPKGHQKMRTMYGVYYPLSWPSVMPHEDPREPFMR